MTHNILRIDASARRNDSVTRDLSDRIIAKFDAASVVTRDLADGLPFVSENWVAANFTPPDDRTADQIAELAISNELLAELRAADTLVIGMPMYNFGVPAVFKAWVDLISRVGETFHYTETGPAGLLSGKRAIVAIASGGTPVESDYDFTSGYMRHILGFIGITDVSFVAADQLVVNAEQSLKAAYENVQALQISA